MKSSSTCITGNLQHPESPTPIPARGSSAHLKLTHELQKCDMNSLNCRTGFSCEATAWLLLGASRAHLACHDRTTDIMTPITHHHHPGRSQANLCDFRSCCCWLFTANNNHRIADRLSYQTQPPEERRLRKNNEAIRLSPPSRAPRRLGLWTGQAAKDRICLPPGPPRRSLPQARAVQHVQRHGQYLESRSCQRLRRIRAGRRHRARLHPGVAVRP
mmetsp:Transcript_11548/g.23697  ORF Transcript_11548/g.23697 Transcript_11548/m.23697 type:complete len:216 (+) Transcript_11548:1328-1975(+)